MAHRAQRMVAVDVGLFVQLQIAQDRWARTLEDLVRFLTDLRKVAVEHDDEKVCAAIESLAAAGTQVAARALEVRTLVQMIDGSRRAGEH